MITEFQKQSVLVSLRDMFRGNHFSICTFDTCKKILGVFVADKDYEALHALHCVNWNVMPKGFPQEVMNKTLELLSGDSFDMTELTLNEQILIAEAENSEPKPSTFLQKLLHKG